MPDAHEITTVEQLDRAVQKMVREGWFHRRRGFSLKSVPTSVQTTHLMEETVEYVGELFHGNYPDQIKEAANVLGVFLHSLYAHGIPLKEVIAKTAVQLNDNFTPDAGEVETSTAGFLRSNRQ